MRLGASTVVQVIFLSATISVFGGANRRRSEKDGLVVYLCKWCHNMPPDGVHYNRANMDALRAKGQLAWMKENDADIDEFIRVYGRNYL